MTTIIRRGRREDAAVIAAFSARTFFETYADVNDPADMAAHLAAKYGEPIQAAELANPSLIYLLVELDGVLIGFALLHLNHAPENTKLICPVEVVRFYVGREWHGQGIAQALMRACQEEAARHGGRTLWLAVWQSNARAIAFYRKAGFAIAGTVTFRLGSQLQNDHMMTLMLEPAAPPEPAVRR